MRPLPRIRILKPTWAVIDNVTASRKKICNLLDFRATYAVNEAEIGNAEKTELSIDNAVSEGSAQAGAG